MLSDAGTLADRGPVSTVAGWLADLDYGRLLDTAKGAAIPVVERFDWQGNSLDPDFRRVRVMARQTYVLCEAGLAGNDHAAMLAERAAAALVGPAIGCNGQFVCRLSRDGQVIDSTPDLYDIAFGLFALAWWYRLSGDGEALKVAKRSVEHLRRAMRSPSGMGYVSRAGETHGHEQNPHMHLFEAAIMLADFSGQETFADLADEMFALAKQKLHDPATGTLPECFDSRWSPVGSAADRGEPQVEPGHHYEWVWLLHRYAALVPDKSALAMADRLYQFAHQHGHDAATGLVVDAVATNGHIIAPALRLWPNTEYLKAQVAMREHRSPAPGHGEADLAANVDRIFRHYLTPAATGAASQLRKGLWIDYLERDAITPKCDHVPASTLYHIVFAFSELIRHANQATAAGAISQARMALKNNFDPNQKRGRQR